MGFGQGITNICRGKAANQSTMVVIFGQTFSGLQGAERLHKLYAESKRGRTEFQQIGLHGSLQTQGVSSNTKENVLYGYLGISIDLDKLDFETKKRCVVKSKKEIKAVADFALNTE
jgi:CO dehydrogenase nickel-insertion accessory protein CooC1